MQATLKNPLSIAPMIDITDRHFRYFLRLITKQTLLYTEMITTSAILHGDRNLLLDFNPSENPLVLQLGGDDKISLAECAKIGESWGYDGINLNVGCPSDRVQQGSFGACLMAEPQKVADAIEAMTKAVKVPVSVKCRIGIRSREHDDAKFESYSALKEFVKIVANAGCTHFAVHARIAILEGLSPKQNRNIPPLRYDDVFQLKKDFPQLRIEINGGITSLEQAGTLLKKVDAVMIGRAAIENPMLFSKADAFIQGMQSKVKAPTSDNDLRASIIQNMIDYVERAPKQNHSHLVLRHLAPIFKGHPGSKRFRRTLSEQMPKHKNSAQALKLAYKEIENETILQ